MPSRAATAALALLALGSGCGSSDGPGDQPPPDAPDAPPVCDPDLPGDREAPPGVSVVFPPANSLTSAAEITVRGTARLDAPVAAIRVNGVPAQSEDGFRHWQVSVPLQPGANTLTVEAEDGNGQIDPDAAQTTVVLAQHPFHAPEALVLDAARNRALVVDHAGYGQVVGEHNALISVDLDTGVRTILHELPVDELGDGYLLEDVALLDADGQRLLLASTAELFSLDLTTGERTVISSDAIGSGPPLARVADIALDADRGRALVVQNGEQPSLMAVDLTTGARSVIADLSLDSGAAARSTHPGPEDVSAADHPPPDLDVAWAVALDAQAGRALVTIGYHEQAALVAVDLTSGARTVISDQATGTGPALWYPEDLALDTAGNRVLVTEFDHGGLLAVDLATGNRTAVSNDSGLLRLPSGVALDAEKGRALLVDEERRALVAMDLATGQRTLISGDVVGSGYELRTPFYLALDTQARRMFVGDTTGSALVSVDLATGDRTVLAGAPGMPVGGTMDVDDRTGRVLLASAEDGLVAVDPATGERTVISGSGVGSGPLPFASSFLLVDEAGDRVFQSTLEGVMSVDLASGARTLLDTNIETRDEWSNLSIAWLNLQPECNRILMASDLALAQALLALSLDTGRVHTVSDFTTCTGVYPSILAAPVYDPVTGRVLGWSGNALLAIDTRTGACAVQVEIEPDRGGPRLTQPRNAALDPATGLLLLVDEFNQALVALDPETGERVLVSR